MSYIKGHQYRSGYSKRQLYNMWFRLVSITRRPDFKTWQPPAHYGTRGKSAKKPMGIKAVRTRNDIGSW